MRTTVTRDILDYEEVVWFSGVPEVAGSHCVTHPGRGSDADWISVERPRVPPRPALPVILWGWVENDDDPTAEPRLRDALEDEERPEVVSSAFEAHLAEWREWTTVHAPRIPLVALYEHLFRMKQQADQLGERYEVVVGAGLALIPGGAKGRVRRHVLTMRVEIGYEQQTARITVRPAPDGLRPEFEDDMLDAALYPSKVLRDNVASTIDAVGSDVWSSGALRDALSMWTQAMRHDAVFDDALAMPEMPADGITVALAPALILRKRTTRSLLAFYRSIDEQLQEGAAVPPLVAGLVAMAEGAVAEPAATIPWTDDEIYFPNLSNSEQRDVLRRLVTEDGVVVVGPPGTGKSHTIANLVSHLLAHGQRVLVTSHTSRALEVLLDKLPDEVRSLSVSMVGDGRAGMQELKRSVGAIVNRSTDPDWQTAAIDQNIKRFGAKREKAHEERRRHLAAIREARENDAADHDPGVSDYRGTLSSIAERVAGERGRFGWASDMDGDEPTLTDADAVELVGLATSITAEMEASARVPLPALPESEDFAALCRRRAELEEAVSSAAASRDLPYAETLARATHADREAVAAAIDALEAGRNAVLLAEPWEAAVFEQVLAGRAAEWRERADRTAEWIAALRGAAATADAVSVTGSLVAEPVVAAAAVDALIAHLESGGGLGVGPFRSKAVRDARAAVGRVKVNGQEPVTVPVLQSLRAWIEVRAITGRAAAMWATERRLDEASAHGLLANLEELESSAQRVLAGEALRRSVVEIAARIHLTPLPAWGDSRAWTTMRRAAIAVDAEVLLAEAKAELAALRGNVEDAGGVEPGDLVPLVLTAIDARDPRAFLAAWVTVEERRALVARVSRRDALLYRLGQQTAEPTAGDLATDASWAARFVEYEAAFWWSRAEGWLHEVLDASSGGAATRVAVLNDEIRGLTASIGVYLAWRACLGSLDKAQLQHLELYQLAMSKYGLGKGKFAATHLAKAQEELQACRAAVPAWIMPTYRVADSLTPGAEPFDVVIIDEASQSGVDALFLLWLGKKVIIVGDDKQISPDGGFIELDPVFAMRQQLLGDQPVGSVITPSTSLFDLGQIAFPGNRTYLKEHFRCMPEIIAFSNRIAYLNSPLEPLRQFGADRLPPLQIRHVTGATRAEGVRKNVNRDEAHALVEAVVDCIGQPAYDGRSFGVISLTGADQAKYIEHLLLQRLGPDKILKSRLKCGDAYAFQGDERDVMFLSMVAAPTEKGNRLPALAGDTYQQRFNVAASRARDQMWLFHSVTQTDLNPDCLRWKLLEHFLHPEEQGPEVELGPVNETDEHPAFDSLFEQRVYVRLKAGGFRVRPQFPAYGYKIDLVVTGGRNRLAIECDGDAWHGPERYEQDLARQQDLERVGWTFVRVRESEFYLDTEAAMRPVWAKLREVGIRPFGEAPELVAEIDAEETEAVIRTLLEPLGEPTTDPDVVDDEEIGPATESPEAPLPRPEPTPSPTPEPTSAGRRTPAFAPYTAWTARRLDDPREARQPDLVAVLLEVVAAEGPILARRAYRQMLHAAGYHRLVHTVVSPLNKAVVRAEREGKLLAVPSGVGSTLADRVLRLPSQEPVVLRARGPRDLEEIPASEIREVARQLRGPGYSPADGELKRQILAAYDRTALTQSASEYLEQCLRSTAPVGPAARVQQRIAWDRIVPPTAQTPAAPQAVHSASPKAPVRLDFARVLAETISKATALSMGGRARLLAEWRLDEDEEVRRRVVDVAAASGAPKDWGVAARAVTARLSDWKAGERGAVVDAAYAFAVDDQSKDVEVLLAPWRHAHEAITSSAPAVVESGPLCRHGKRLGTCLEVTCSGHPLGGISLTYN